MIFRLLQFNNRKLTEDQISNEYREKLLLSMPSIMDEVNWIMGIYNQHLRSFDVEMERELAIMPDYRDDEELRTKHTMVKTNVLNEVCYWKIASMSVTLPSYLNFGVRYKKNLLQRIILNVLLNI